MTIDVEEAEEQIYVERLSLEELVEYSRYGAAQLVEELATQGLQTRIDEAVDSRENTMLHMAAANGHIELASVILQRCIDRKRMRERANAQGNTALHWACVAGQLAVVRLLVEEDAALLTMENKAGRTPLCEAQQHGRQDILSFLEGKFAQQQEQTTHMENE